MTVAHQGAEIFVTSIFVNCKNDVDKPARLPRERWDTVDVLTVAAPNLRHVDISDEELFDLHESRLRHMLTVAAHQGAEIFVTSIFVNCKNDVDKPA